MLNKLFRNSRYFVLVTIVVSSVSALMLYLASIVIVFNIVVDFLNNMPASADGGKRLAVRLLKVLDTLLIAVTFQIIAAGLFRLFISRVGIHENSLLSALQIRDFHDLKVTLMQVAVVILVVVFLEHAVEGVGGQELLYHGIAIAVVIAAAVFAWRGMSKHCDDEPKGPESPPQ